MNKFIYKVRFVTLKFVDYNKNKIYVSMRINFWQQQSSILMSTSEKIECKRIKK